MVGVTIDPSPSPIRSCPVLSGHRICKMALHTKKHFSYRTSQAAPSWVAHAIHSRIIHEPAHSISTPLINKRTRQSRALLKDLLEHLLLPGACRHKRNPHRMVHHGQGKRNPLRRRLGAILNRRDPRVRLAQQLMAREQRASMPIRPAAEQDQVEDRQLDGVALRKVAHEELLVLVRHLLDVIEMRDIDGVDGRGAELGGDLVEELGFQERVVAVCVVEGDGALVREEDLPLGEVDGVVGGGGGGEERRGQGLGEGAARDGDFEGAVPADARVLRLDDVVAEAGGEVVDGGEGVEVWLFTHLGGLWCESLRLRCCCWCLK